MKTVFKVGDTVHLKPDKARKIYTVTSTSGDFDPDRLLVVDDAGTKYIFSEEQLFKPRAKRTPATQPPAEEVTGDSPEPPQPAPTTATAVTLGKHEILGQDKLKQKLAVAAQLDIPVLIVGDTGTGKTTVVKELADKEKKQWIRFNLTGDTTVDEFVGKYTLSNKSTVWEDGVLIKAMKTGQWLIVDEINVALPEILFVLHSLLDDDRNITVVNHNAEVITPHKDFRFFATMNPVDEYAGTKDLNKAFKSRFGMILNMEYPKPRVEVDIVSGKGGVDKQTASQIVDVGNAIRTAKQSDKVFYTCSTRDLIQWATLVPVIGLRDSFEVTILNKANGDFNMVNEVFKKITGLYITAKNTNITLNIDAIRVEAEKLAQDRKDFNKEKTVIEDRIRKELLQKLMGTREAGGSNQDRKQELEDSVAGEGFAYHETVAEGEVVTPGTVDPYPLLSTMDVEIDF